MGLELKMMFLSIAVLIGGIVQLMLLVLIHRLGTRVRLLEAYNAANTGARTGIVGAAPNRHL